MGGNSGKSIIRPLARRALRVLLLAALLVSAPSQLAILVEDPGTFSHLSSPRPQSEEVHEAMRYHGTDSAFWDGTAWYFRDRKGQTCPLFTDACRRALGKSS